MGCSDWWHLAVVLVWEQPERKGWRRREEAHDFVGPVVLVANRSCLHLHLKDCFPVRGKDRCRSCYWRKDWSRRMGSRRIDSKDRHGH